MRKRNCSITIRLTEEERDQLMKNVHQSGRSLQDYLLYTSLNGRVTTAEEMEELKKRNLILESMDRQLRGMGTNINQIAHKANGYGIIPTENTLCQIREEFQMMKNEVKKEWQLTRRSINPPTHMEP